MVHIFHCYHNTGRFAKKVVEKHPGKEDKIVIMVEGECCKCSKRRWVRDYVPGDHGDVMHYPASRFPELPFLEEVVK